MELPSLKEELLISAENRVQPPVVSLERTAEAAHAHQRL
jgi:hypothetical protein